MQIDVVQIIQESESFYKIFSKDREHLLKIYNHFSYFTTGYQYMPLYKSGKWDGKIKLFDFIEKRLPIGLVDQLIEFLESHQKKMLLLKIYY
jgi:hypothetical protein